jgi:N-acetylmuramoyl-L-alanine amidase
MRTHIIKQGECIATIAQANGFSSEALYQHPDNAELRKKRPNPNILHPGDSVLVPQRETKSLTAQTGATHRFQVKLAKRELRLVLLDYDGKPIANTSYVLEIEGERAEGQTTGDGEVKQAISNGSRSAILSIRGRELILDCSCLNPLTDVPDGGTSGARERLRNLGYAVGDGSDNLDPATRTALALFQHEAKLEVTGNLDDATCSKLIAAHRC